MSEETTNPEAEVTEEATEAIVEETPVAEEAAQPAEAKEEKTVDTSKLSANATKVVDMVSEMTVLELAELVKVLEDKFGVSAAPVAVAAAGGAAAGAGEAAHYPSHQLFVRWQIGQLLDGRSFYDLTIHNSQGNMHTIIALFRKLVY